jgi:hypothetical protein
MSGGDVGVTITCELPNSKSWIKLTAEVDDPARRVRGLFRDAVCAGAFPGRRISPDTHAGHFAEPTSRWC